jgi:hypothetical protein
MFEVVLDDGEGRVVHVPFEPVFGWYPTEQWRPDETIHTTQTLTVPPQLGPGQYALSVRARTARGDPVPITVATLTVTGESTEAWPNEVRPAERPHESLAAHARTVDESLARHDHQAAFAAARDALRLDPSNVRLTRRLEDIREQLFWIEYYGQRQHYAELVETFDRAWKADALPADHARLEDLYYALLSAGDESRATRVRERTGLPVKPEVTWFDDGTPLISLIDYRIELRPPETMSRLHVFLKAHRAPAHGIDLLVDLTPPQGATITLPQPIDRGGGWQPGEIVAQEVFLWPPPGDYDIRLRFARRDDATSPLCTDVQPARCDMSLGLRTLGRHVRDFWPTPVQ